MKLWINFEEKDIKKRIGGWEDGDDFEGQLIFQEEQDLDNCFFDFTPPNIELHFTNGVITMTKEELGGLFK